jgi:hypothetical protein
MEKPTVKVVKIPHRDATMKRETIAIPKEDVLGARFPTIRINFDAFEAGGFYEVDENLASVVKNKIKVYNDYALRLMRPRVHEHEHEDVIGA